MTERIPDTGAVNRDDQLLDLLARGALPTAADPAIRALYAWRAELTADLDDVRPAVTNGHRLPLPEAGRLPAVNGFPHTNGSPAAHDATGAGSPRATNGTVNGRANGHPVALVRVNGSGPHPTALTRTVAGPGRGRRRAAFAAALLGVSTGFGGVAVAAADAEPGSTLWPFTRVIYADIAAHRQAEADVQAALARARRALAEGRTAEAERYLDEAYQRAGAAGSEHADELRNEVRQVRSRLHHQRDSGSGTDPRSPREKTSPEPDEENDRDDGNGPDVRTPDLPAPDTDMPGGGEAGGSDHDASTGDTGGTGGWSGAPKLDTEDSDGNHGSGNDGSGDSDGYTVDDMAAGDRTGAVGSGLRSLSDDPAGELAEAVSEVLSHAFVVRVSAPLSGSATELGAAPRTPVSPVMSLLLSDTAASILL